MSFAMLCVPDGLFVFALALLVAFGGVCLLVAVFVTMGLAKWAAERQKRLAADIR